MTTPHACAVCHAEMRHYKSIVEDPERWMRWCDHKVLERCEALEAVLRHFIAYYASEDGCANCGGVPHTVGCYVSLFQQVLDGDYEMHQRGAKAGRAGA